MQNRQPSWLHWRADGKPSSEGQAQEEAFLTRRRSRQEELLGGGG